jgi:AcrR family transcriptional regulator
VFKKRLKEVKMKKDSKKDRILEVVLDMMANGTNMGEVTVRDIAGIANVNIALINYYYGSKDNLIYIAASKYMDGITSVGKSKEVNQNKDINPLHVLENMVIGLGDFLFSNVDIAMISVNQEMQMGNSETVSKLIPLLKEVFKGKGLSETQLKVIALQIVVPLQVIFLNADNYAKTQYINFYDKITRDKITQQIINNVIRGNS